jgi:hypothetical protein
MGLSLVIGPAHAGKVALLLERYLAALPDDPWLIVPTRADVEPVERDLLRRCGGLLGGRITTFDGLFEHLARAGDPARPLVSGAGRSLLVRRVLAGGGDTRDGSGRFPGYAEALAAAVSEIDAALLEPGAVDGVLAETAQGLRAELDALGLWDRDALRRAAIERLTGDFAAWEGGTVFAYGFEDLTGAEWRLLEALAARGDLHVSNP